MIAFYYFYSQILSFQKYPETNAIPTRSQSCIVRKSGSAMTQIPPSCRCYDAPSIAMWCVWKFYVWTFISSSPRLGLHTGLNITYNAIGVATATHNPRKSVVLSGECACRLWGHVALQLPSRVKWISRGGSGSYRCSYNHILPIGGWWRSSLMLLPTRVSKGEVTWGATEWPELRWDDISTGGPSRQNTGEGTGAR
jgi:hypothetical protein